MQKRSIVGNREYFTVLQTAQRTQTAVMTLQPGETSGPMQNEHPRSEQVVLLLEGRLTAEIGKESSIFEAGDVVIVPLGVDHRFINHSDVEAVTFNVYGPPAY